MLYSDILPRKRIMLARQTEQAECALACLSMIVSHHGLRIDLASLRRQFPISSRGVNLASLMKIADQLYLSPRAVRVDLPELGALHLPAILHWEMSHFVVLSEVRRGRALIYDPRGLVRWFGQDELSGQFTGVALELRPTPDFQPSKQVQKLHFRHLWGRLTGLKRVFAQVLILSLLLQILTLISPYYIQTAIDSAIPALDRNLVLVLAVGFALLALFNVAATFLRGFVLLSAGSELALGLSANLTRKLFRLPMDWFQRRHVGDVLSRYVSILPIRLMLVEGAAAAAMDSLLAALTLVVMMFYSLTLTAISVVAFLVYLVIRQVSYAAQRRAQESAIIAAGREQTNLMESIRGITTVRLFGRETMRHAIWQSRFVDSMNSTIHVQRIALWQTCGAGVVFALENIAVIAVAVDFVIVGRFTVGMLFAFMAYKAQFSSTAQSVITHLIDFRMLGLHLERLSDIVLTDEDPTLRTPSRVERDLIGHIEVRNVTFRYAPDEPAIFSGLDLDVAAGESVAITGPSGDGKSTLVKLLLGLVEPEAGEVLIDGLPIAEFGYDNFREQLSAVMQDDALFEGSIAENIALFDEKRDIVAVKEAARTAAIEYDIEKMPMKYETLIGDLGSSISGGQRQRILLARAIYRQPRLLLLDEATSHLDIDRERHINDKIRSLGITRIIIAHRKETMASADRILRLEHGRLIAMES